MQRTLERPMHDMLKRAARRTSLHMPGAQGKAPFGRWNPYRLETTELGITDDLYRPSGAIARAQALAAKSAGAADTLLLHGGSTAGIHAMLLYAARRGDEVILPRNTHISAIQLCAVAGLVPAFASPSYTAAGRPYTTPESYLRAMEEHPRARAALVVRPDYYGLMPDLRAIARLAHERGMLLLCDEAHGAHLNWDAQAENALACGADLCVQSAHKTLPALNAGAWLHAARGVDVQRLRGVLRMVQTSSPSFVAMLALDDARAWMDAHGARACADLRAAAADFHRAAAALGYLDGQAAPPPGTCFDPLRVVLDAPQGGFELSAQLEALGLDVELCDACGIGCILSLMDGKKRLALLLRALKRVNRARLELPKGHGLPLAMPPRALPPCVIPLDTAAFAPAEPVALPNAIGRVSAAQVGLYPPGVALLTAGELVTEEIAHYLMAIEPSHLFGVGAGETISCVQIKGENQ
ncbi:MAG: aminotransferase class I/II-fold pyridoxal phosphate-dependent enzyme [Clostridia bacterium]